MPPVPVKLSSTAVVFVAILLVAAMPSAGQTPPQTPQQQAQEKPPSPPKPYEKVSVTLAPGVTDPSLDAFRKQLADAAMRKDRAALGRLTVAKEFFWERENGNAADKNKSGIDNLAAAVGLDAKDDSGWRLLADYAQESSLSQVGDRKDFVCAPATPLFDDKQFEAILKSTDTDPGEWGYPLRDGTEVRDSAAANAKPVEKLGRHFVRVLPEETSANSAGPVALRIVLPSGKTGYVAEDALLPLGVDQLCFIKQGGAWKIAGYIGEGGE